MIGELFEEPWMAECLNCGPLPWAPDNKGPKDCDPRLSTCRIRAGIKAGIYPKTAIANKSLNLAEGWDAPSGIYDDAPFDL